MQKTVKNPIKKKKIQIHKGAGAKNNVRKIIHNKTPKTQKNSNSPKTRSASKPKAKMTPHIKPIKKPQHIAQPKKLQIKKSRIVRKPNVPVNDKVAERKAQKAEKMAKQLEINTAAYTENALKYIDTLVNEETISNYLNKNVSRYAPDVLNMLSTPKTDEELAASLDLKINTVRRILNIMQGYGITNYTISKNNEGWLSFAWYININKVPQFFDYVKNTTTDKSVLKDDCNDYFICDKCYDVTKLIFTFDAAYEASFKCNTCNKQLSRISKPKVTELTSTSQKQAPNQLQ